MNKYGPFVEFGKSRNGIVVLYDPTKSHFSTHIADNPKLNNAVLEIVSGLKLNPKKEHTAAHTLDYIVGTTDLVVNKPGDEIIYALRKNRTKYAPFNKSQGATESNIVTLRIKPFRGDKSHQSMYMYTAWVGGMTPPLPYGNRDKESYKEYWNRHSLAWGKQEVDPDSITTECPW